MDSLIQTPMIKMNYSKISKIEKNLKKKNRYY